MKSHSTKTRHDRRRTLIITVCCVLATLIGARASARAAEVNTGYFGNTAIMGYDTVAYFTMKKAVKGSKQHSHEWLGGTWLFASDKHRKSFIINPLKYAPQYGGLCSVGVGYGEVTREIDPEAWSVIKGKLYLNYAKNVTEEFDANSEELIAKADKNWPSVKTALSSWKP